MTAMIDSLTPECSRLFLDLVEDSYNWRERRRVMRESHSAMISRMIHGGALLVDTTDEQRSNLTELKRIGLIRTKTGEGYTWCYFTALGRAAARSLGHELLY